MTSIAELQDGTPAVVVAYGTSEKTTQLDAGELVITPADGEAFGASGLAFSTKFNLKSRVTLPYTDEWFRIPPVPHFGQTPKLGILHPSLMRRAQAAFAAASPSGPD